MFERVLENNFEILNNLCNILQNFCGYFRKNDGNFENNFLKHLNKLLNFKKCGKRLCGR